MKAADVMSSPVIGVGTEAPLSQAVRLMVENRISGLMVLDGGGCAVGVLTEGDLLRRAETGTEGKPAGWFRALFTSGRLADAYVQTHGRRAGDVMTREVVGVAESTPLAEVVETMRSRRIRRVPVLRGGVAVGVVSRADVIRALAEELDAPAAHPGDDEIRRRIVAELAGQPWAPHRSISVAVTGGVVELDGVVFDPRALEAVRVAAETVPGVTRVENRVVCVEPQSGILLGGVEDKRG